MSGKLLPVESPKVEFDDDSFWIPPVEGISLCGHKVKCNKCHRKILVQLPLAGVPHHLDAMVCCGDCLEIDAEFKKMYPDLAADLEKWKHGILIKAGVPTKNNRVYTEECLKKMAESNPKTLFYDSQTKELKCFFDLPMRDGVGDC